GWAVCDGAKGTPDLRDKFVIGSGNGAKNAFKTTGGNEQVTPIITVQGHTLTISELPSHNHAGATGIENTDVLYYDLPADGDKNTLCQWRPSGGRWCNTKAYSGLNKFQHVHSISPEGGNQPHSHTATSSEINLRPPFYALLYIMKL
ncbi:unnamed protein product, partial [Rotaria sordida]